MSYLCLSPIISLQIVKFICTVLEQEKICIYRQSVVSTNLGKRSVRYKANKFLNSLLDSVKVIGTSKQFMNKLKICLQSAVISNNS